MSGPPSLLYFLLILFVKELITALKILKNVCRKHIHFANKITHMYSLENFRLKKTVCLAAHLVFRSLGSGFIFKEGKGTVKF